MKEITQEALSVLYRELGIVNTVRFLNQFTAGFGNYTEERRAATENQTLEEVLADVYTYQAKMMPKRNSGLRSTSATSDSD
jgi:hypothetical protein